MKKARDQIMKNTSTRLELALLGFCFILLITFSASLCSGSVVWSDDFNDGNYNGWTVDNGTFSATNHQLEVIGQEDDWAVIKYPSTIAYGTWSLDIYVNESADSNYDWIKLLLLADEILPQTDSADIPISNGYVIAIDPATGIFINPGPPVIQIFRYTDSESYQFIRNSVNPFYGWLNVSIIRDTSGTFRIYINELYFEITDNTHSTTAFFGLASYVGHAFDNVVVDNAISALPFDLVFIGVIITIIIIIVVIISVVIVLRRRT